MTSDPPQRGQPQIDLGGLRWLGLLPLSFFAIHGSRHVLSGHAYELLWLCTVSCFFVGVGILARSPRWTAAAALWLPLGTVLWIFDACRTGDFLLTSALTHLGGLLVALVWLGRTGFPAGSFVYATGLGVLVQTVSRYVSPHEANVNVSQFIYPGSEAYFPSYRLYWCFIWLSATAIFWICERIGRRIWPGSSASVDDGLPGLAQADKVVGIAKARTRDLL